jgi:hypothetical protein
MNNPFDVLTAPFDNKSYCNYYYIYTLFFGIILILSLISSVGFILFNLKKVKGMMIFNMFMLNVNIFLAYFANRLLYSMCVKSI